MRLTLSTPGFTVPPTMRPGDLGRYIPRAAMLDPTLEWYALDDGPARLLPSRWLQDALGIRPQPRLELADTVGGVADWCFRNGLHAAIRIGGGANLVLVEDQTIQSFQASGGSVTFTLTSLGVGAGRLSAQLDLGAPSATARPKDYSWTSSFDFTTDPVVGEFVEHYRMPSDGTFEGDDLGTADAAISSKDTIKNAKFLGATIVRSTTAANLQQGNGRFVQIMRYLSAIWWNATADVLGATAGNLEWRLEPHPMEIQ